VAVTLRDRRWIILGFLVAAAIINYADRQVIAVLKPDIQREMGWTDGDYGTLASLFQFAAATGLVFAGWLVDRLGIRYANPVGVAAWSLAAMGHALARTLAQFSLVRVALGATEAIGTPMAMKTVSALFDADERSNAIGLSNASTNIGAIVTPLLLAPVAAITGWRAAFLLVGGAGLVWVAAWLLAVRNWSPPETAAAAEAKPQTSYRAILASRTTWAIIGAKALSDQVWWLLLFWAPDLFHRVFHLTTAQLGVPLAIVYAFAAAGSLFGGAASARLVSRGMTPVRARLTLISGAAVVALAILGSLGASGPLMAAGMIGVTLAAHQTFSVNLFALIGDVTPGDRVGSVTSLGALFGNLAGMGIVALAGFILQSGMGYTPLVTIAGLSYLAGAGWLWLVLPATVKAVAPSDRA
jgi:ACS family hexuronate transporter-like MFS transporter